MSDETKLPKEIDDYDWQQIFEGSDNDAPYTRGPTHVRTKKIVDVHYTRADVVRVIATSDGEADEREWVGLFEMRDGKFVSVRAGCDYTGWDCRADGSSDVADTEGDAIAFGLTEAERTRLNLAAPPLSVNEPR